MPATIDRWKMVESEGRKDAPIAIVGEAPSVVELRQNRPFRGPAGTVLEECLHGGRIVRSGCYLTNVFPFKVTKRQYRGGESIHDPDGKRLWSAKESFTDLGRKWLKGLRDELSETTSNVIVPLGNTALDALTGQQQIYKRRGSIYESTLLSGRKVVGTIHPAATVHGDFFARYYIMHDLRRVKEESGYPHLGIPHQRLEYDLTSGEVVDRLRWIVEQGRMGRRVNFDIETLNQEISIISFAVDISYGFCAIFNNQMSVDEEMKIWRLIAEIMEDPEIPICNQNLLFDMDVLARRAKIVVRGQLDDPMVAHSLIYPDFPKGLDFLTSIYTKIPYYKDEGHEFFMGRGTDLNKLFRYACQDSCVAIECMNKLDKEINEKDMRTIYEQTLRLYHPLLAMQQRGLRVDKEAIDRERDRLKARQRELQDELDTIAGEHLNVNSSKQCKEYFYERLRIPPYKNKGRPTTDDTAMSRLAKGTSSRKPLREAELIQQIRKIRKLISTYLDSELDARGRLICSFNPRGTTTGRLSSSKNINTGTGMNLQNQPNSFKRFILADEGYLLCEIDKRQAEWVVVAYASRDPRMIDVIENNRDPHSTTGSLISKVEDLDLIKEESKLVGHETDPQRIKKIRQEHFPFLLAQHKEGSIYLPRTMSIRQAGKKTNHGANYGIGKKRFALVNEIQEAEADYMLEAYHAGYPGIRATYHSQVQKDINRNRTLTNPFGRKRTFFGKMLDHYDRLQVWMAGYDFIAQSTVGDLVNRGMIETYDDALESMGLVELLNQVHDSILIQFPVDLVDDGYIKMANAINIIYHYLDPPIKMMGNTFHIETDMKVGLNWRDMEEVERGETVEGLADRLSEIHAQLRAT